MRSFPSAPRRRAVTALLAVVLASCTGSSLLVPATAYARTGGLAAELPGGLAAGQTGDLRDKQRALRQRIEGVQNGIDEASDTARAAADLLASATTRLGGARDRLTGVEDQLERAVARNAGLRVRLAASRTRLTEARGRLVQGRIDVVDTRDEAAGTITTIYQGTGDPGLRTFASFLTAGSLDEIEREQQAEQLMVGRQSGAYDDVRAAEDRLEATEQEVAEVTAQVESEQEAAAGAVARQRALRQDALAARDHVLRLVERNRGVQARARRARAEDREALAALRVQEASVKKKILVAGRAAARAGDGYSGPTGGLLAMPAGGRVSSPFGVREHPIYHYRGLHDGIDLAPGCGARLTAVADGTVISRSSSEVYGKRLYLSLGTVNDTVVTAVYNHAAAYSVRVGQRVSRGQVLGRVGDTGWSTGCHLHFTILKDGVPVDPSGYL